jgi:hypothetical protein
LAAVTISSAFVNAFTSSPYVGRSLHHIILLPSLRNNEESHSTQKKLEQVMENSSSGAKAIAAMDLQERTKRAMLAEAAENRIFELVDELELLIKRNNGYESFSEYPDDVREEALEMAKQIKASQVQYDDLVNGRPSVLLDLEGAFVNNSLNPPSSFGDNHV